MNISNKTISIAFIVVLIVTVGVSVIGMSLMSRQPMVLQGQVEATEIRISGKLPGRVDSFLVQEGDWVKAGDTLVVINSPTIEAKYRQVNALEQVAQEQNKKIDAGTRRQIIATALQLWNKTQSDLTLAQTTYQRILTLYKFYIPQINQIISEVCFFYGNCFLLISGSYFKAAAITAPCEKRKSVIDAGNDKAVLYYV